MKCKYSVNDSCFYYDYSSFLTPIKSKYCGMGNISNKLPRAAKYRILAHIKSSLLAHIKSSSGFPLYPSKISVFFSQFLPPSCLVWTKNKSFCNHPERWESLYPCSLFINSRSRLKVNPKPLLKSTWSSYSPRKISQKLTHLFYWYFKTGSHETLAASNLLYS